jgi:hypothetical protein
LSGKCAAITRSGESCRGLVRPGNNYCPAHDPSRQEARRRAASKAGRSKPRTEVQQVKGRLKALAEGVLLGTIDKGDAAVVAQVWNTYLRAVSVELKVREVEEFETRLEEIESSLLQRDEQRWG